MLKIRDYLKLEKHKITTKFDCSITIDKSKYKPDEIEELPQQYSIPTIFDIYYPDVNDSVHIVLPYNEIKINKTSTISEDNKHITISYEKDDVIIDQEYVDKSTDLKTVKRIVNGSVKSIKSPETILQLMHNALPASDLVHFEIIVSQMFRDKNENLSRISGKYDELWGAKKIGKNESWKSALSYQDVNSGIKKGLIGGKSTKNNVVEKILDGKFDNI